MATTKTSTAAPPSVGQEVSVTLQDGRVKTGKLIAIDSDGISLLTDDGGGKIAFDSMSKQDQARYGYTAPVGEAKASVIGSPKPSFVGQSVKIILTDGTEKSGTITLVEPDGISLLTDSGGGKVLFDSMTDADKAKFGFDQAAEDAYKTQQASVQAEAIMRGKENRQREINEAIQEQNEKAQRAALAEKYAHQFMLTGTIMQFIRGDNPGTLIQQTDMSKEIIFLKGQFVDGHFSDPVSLQVASDGWYDYVDKVGEDIHARQCLIPPDEFKQNLPVAAPSRVVFPAPDQ